MAKQKAAPKPKRPMGRPSKLTPELQSELCRWLRAGNYIETACHLMNISKRTVFSWLSQGRAQKRGKYREFLHAVREAQAHSETVLLATISKASAKDWKAAAWRLERMKPRRYGPARLIVTERVPELHDSGVDVEFNLIGDDE